MLEMIQSEAVANWRRLGILVGDRAVMSGVFPFLLVARCLGC